MLGTGLQFDRSRNGENRFCSAARARDCLRSGVNSGRTDEPPPEKSIPASQPAPEPSPLCNLERFLESVTPAVPAQYFSKMKVRSWRSCEAEFQPYFVLSDLWESYKEWSAYGIGMPLVLNDRDGVVQYYVPYLSGIQLYVDRSKSRAKLSEESDSEYSSSDGEVESVNSMNYSREGEQLVSFQDGFSSDEGECRSSQGILLFEYLERDPPYCREPLADKISDLAIIFPQLKTLRSCDLHPSSWISVAWYPIYRIPTGPTLRDLDACFLTFHSLDTGGGKGGSEVMHPVVESDGVPQILVSVFGLASYKYKAASLWTPNTGYHRDVVNSLLQAAITRMRLLRVNHPDFSFFNAR